MKKGVLKNFEKYTLKHLCQGLFADKVCNVNNKETVHGCFTVNFAKFLRTLFLQNTSGRLLLSSKD